MLDSSSSPPQPEQEPIAEEAAELSELFDSSEFNAQEWLQTQVLDPLYAEFSRMLTGIIGAIPNLIKGTAILIVGWLVAAIIRRMVGTTLEKIGFDDVLEKAGVSRLLMRLGVAGSPTRLIARALFWVIMLFMVKSAAGQFGVADLTALIESVLAFLPRVITAAIILLIGFMVADVVQNVVTKALDDMGITYAKTLGGLLFGFICILVLTVALPMLGVQTELLNASVKIVLSGISVALALCLGFGLKSLAQGIVSGVYARDLYSAGTRIEIEGDVVEIRGIGPVTTKCMRDDGAFVIIPNQVLLESKIVGYSSL